MSVKRRKFQLGVRLKPTAEATTLEGELSANSSSLTFKAYIDGAERDLVTADQSQTLTNKDIDADNNTISNIETDNLKAGVLVTDISAATSDTELPSALAVKTALDGQNEASEINYDNSTSGLTATEVQSAIDEVEGRVDSSETALSDHLVDAIDAHDASAISNAPTGNLAATDVQGALDELQTEIDALPDKTETLQNKTLDSSNVISGSIEAPVRLDVKQDTEANLITYAATASDGQLCFATDTLKMYQVITNELQPVGGGGSTSFEIDQVAHGLSVGNGILHNGTEYVLAQANDPSTLAYHVVVEVIDANTFVAADFGRIEVLAHGFTVGQYYFQSEATAGLPVSTEPVSGYSNPLFYAEDANTLQIKCLRPSPIGDTIALDEVSDVSVPTPLDGQALIYDVSNLRWEAKDLAGSTYVITQAAHGFAIGDGIFHNGTDYEKGLADNAATLAYYVVVAIDGNDFTMADMTRVEAPSHGYTVGQFYWLSDSVLGQATNVEPSSGFSNPLFYVEDANTLQIKCLRPDAIQGIDLDDLDNVAVAAPTDKQVLAYNNSNSTWEAQDAVSAAADVTYDNATSGLAASNVQAAIDEVVATPELDKLTDVTITARKDGQVLKYDEAADQMINAPIKFNMLANHEDLTPTLVSVTATKDAAVFLPIDVNTQSMRITFAGSAGSYLQESALNSELDGLQGVLRAWIKTDQDNVQVSSTIDGVVQSSLTVISTNKWKQYEIPIVMSGTNMGIQISSASAITGNVYLDQVELEIAKVSQDISVISAWESYTPVAEGVGTITSVDMRYRRVGSNLQIRGEFTTGTTTAVTFKLYFPTGLIADSSLPSSNQHYGRIVRNAGSSAYAKDLFALSAADLNYIGITASDDAVTVSPDAMQLASSFFGGSNRITVHLDIPIQGWSATPSTIVSQSTTLTAKTANTLTFTGSYVSGTTTHTMVDDIYGVVENVVPQSGSGWKVDFEAGLFSETPKVICESHNNSGSMGEFLVYNVTKDSFFTQAYNMTGAVFNFTGNYDCTVTKHSSDYNKDATIIGKFEQIRSDDLALVEGAGNGSTPLTVNVTNIDFTETNDPTGSWDGSIFTAQSAGNFNFQGQVRFTAGVGANLFFYKSTGGGAFVGGQIITDNGASVVQLGFNASISLNAGDRVAIRSNTAATLSNSSILHYLTITQQATKESIVANLMQGQTTKCQTKILSANSSSIGDIADLTFNNLKIGKLYSYNLNISLASAANVILVDGTGTDYVGQTYTTGGAGWFTLSNIYKTKTTTLTTRQLSTATVSGNGSKSTTFMTLCELPETVIETTEFD